MPRRGLRLFFLQRERALSLSLFLLINLLPQLSTAQLQNADYSGKVNVKVSEILTNRPNAVDRSWPPQNSHEFSRVEMQVFGRNIDGATYHNLHPRGENTNVRKLRKILGSHFNREWMSIQKPISRSNKDHLPKTLPDPELNRQLPYLNFTFVDDVGARIAVPDNMLRLWKQWLIRQATCPIQYFWEDLGKLFWPQYVRRGHCVSTHRCSWPAGMRCRPSNSRSLNLLQWKCEEETEAKKRKRASKDRRHRRKRRKERKQRQKQQRERMMRSRGKRNHHLSRHWMTRKLKRQRRIRRRLIRRLSMLVNGYYCHWIIQRYVVNDRCSCMCPQT